MALLNNIGCAAGKCQYSYCHMCSSLLTKADQIECRRKQEVDGGTRGPRGHVGGRRGEDATRVEIWIRPTGHPGTSRLTGSESGKDSEQDGELGTLSPSDVSAYVKICVIFSAHS